jgi:hypothetical protein
MMNQSIQNTFNLVDRFDFMTKGSSWEIVFGMHIQHRKNRMPPSQERLVCLLFTTELSTSVDGLMSVLVSFSLLQCKSPG